MSAPFNRDRLPGPARALDRWLVEACDAVAAASSDRPGSAADAVNVAARRPGTVPEAYAGRLLAETTRIALEQHLSEGVDAEALGDVLVETENNCAVTGLPFDPAAMITVLTGAFGLAPTRDELREAAEQDDDQARRLLASTEALEATSPMTWHAVVLLAQLCPTRSDLRRVLDAAWAEIMRADQQDG